MHIILLFGLPRSGTTWIGKILDSHPQTFYRHEPDSWGLLNAVPLFPPRDQFGRYVEAIRNFAERLPQMTASKVNASLPVFPKHYYTPWRLQGRRLLASASKLGSRMFGEFPAPSLVSSQRLQMAPIVWKSIESVGRMGAVVSALDHVHAILLLRHPCGYTASVLRGEANRKFTSPTSSSDDYGVFEQLLQTSQARSRDLSLAYLHSLEPVERLAWRWVLYNEKAMSDLQGRSDVLVVRYEDICSKPAEMVQKIFDFSGLSWNQQTADFIAASTSTERGSYYSVVKDPIKAANKWRTELSPDDQRRIMDIVRDTLPGRLYREDPLPTEAVAADA